MAFLMVRVEIPALDVDQLNSKMMIDSTKPHDGTALIRNLMDGLLAGAVDGEIEIAIRATTQAVTAQGGGDSGTYNLL